MIKTYSYNGLNYGFNKQFKKWVFKLPHDTELLVACGGQETAHKVAHIVNGAINRCGQLDGLARANMRQVGAI